jgi:diadenosine tetraphosphate (Ap4A) HIT family hydrolase
VRRAVGSRVVPETPEDLHARAVGALRMPPVHEWETFPFEGDLRVRPFEPPVSDEPPRVGAGGVDCHACERPDHDFLWTDDRWRLSSLPEPSGLPVVVILFPRTHVDIGDLPSELAAELGPLMVRIERAVRAVGDIGRVHVCRFGDGSEHLHWWFIGRPARMPQLKGSFATIWDDILPPLPEELWRANLEIVARGLSG